MHFNHSFLNGIVTMFYIMLLLGLLVGRIEINGFIVTDHQIIKWTIIVFCVAAVSFEAYSNLFK